MEVLIKIVKKQAIGVFIDLKKVFDTVAHKIPKKNYYGVYEIAHDWIKSYFLDRKQFVNIHIVLFAVSYFSEIWHNICASNIRCITVLQKRVVRLICGIARLEHTSTLFKQLSILTFVNLVNCKTAIIMYKAYHNKATKKFAFRVIMCISLNQCVFLFMA